MCSVNPGYSCVPPRQSLFASVRPTVSFPGKVVNLFISYFFFFYLCILVKDIRVRCGAAEPRQSPSTVLFIDTGFGHLLWRAESLLVLAQPMATVSIVSCSTLLTSV